MVEHVYFTDHLKHQIAEEPVHMSYLMCTTKYANGHLISTLFLL
jgi:hypothetical protein